jgi:hypothetical protein
VAEGIETTETCYWLADRGCDFGQGYAISRPLPATAFMGWMEERTKRIAEKSSSDRRREAWPLSDTPPQPTPRATGRQNSLKGPDAPLAP